jgi:hypothetical protein
MRRTANNASHQIHSEARPDQADNGNATREVQLDIVGSSATMFTSPSIHKDANDESHHACQKDRTSQLQAKSIGCCGSTRNGQPIFAQRGIRQRQLHT